MVSAFPWESGTDPHLSDPTPVRTTGDGPRAEHADGARLRGDSVEPRPDSEDAPVHRGEEHSETDTALPAGVPDAEGYRSLVDAATQVLDRVDQALGRLADGSYGRCSQCGAPIPPEVLEDDPTAQRCPADADHLDAERAEAGDLDAESADATWA
jgi:RNA polymerase-binding transcription factor DksA